MLVLQHLTALFSSRKKLNNSCELIKSFQFDSKIFFTPNFILLQNKNWTISYVLIKMQTNHSKNQPEKTKEPCLASSPPLFYDQNIINYC